MRRDAGLKVSKEGGVVYAKKSMTGAAVAERKRLTLHHVAMGKSKTQIARDMGIDRTLLYLWLKSDPVFAEEWERVAAEGQRQRDEGLADEMEEGMIGLARGETTKDNVPNFSAIKHMLQVTNPKRHGDKKQVEHTGTVVHSLIPQAQRLDALLGGDVIDVTPEEDDA